MPRLDVVRTQERTDGCVDLYTTGGYAANRGLARVVRTRQQTYCCMTCVRLDCEHARAAQAHFAVHGATTPAETPGTVAA